MRKTLTLAFAATLALAACGKREEDNAAAVNNLVEPPVENVIIDEPDALPPPAATNNMAAAVPVPAPDISEDQQVQDDAAATGMTARLPADGESSPAEAEASNAAE